MTQLTIIDGNNWARRGFAAGRTVRQMWNQVWEYCQVGPCFVVWDGMDSRAPRRELFPEYKAQRGKAGEDVYESMKFLKNMIRLTSATMFEIPKIEADDVIADIAMKWDGPVLLNSNDVDLAAIDKKDLILTEDITVPCEKHYLRLFKTLVGDNSDNIKGLPGFGEGSFKLMKEEYRDQLIDLFEGDDLEALRALLLDECPKRCQRWLGDLENIQLLKTYWTIIGFMPIPTPQPEHIVNGTPNLSGARDIFERFLDADPNRQTLEAGTSLAAY